MLGFNIPFKATFQVNINHAVILADVEKLKVRLRTDRKNSD